MSGQTFLVLQSVSPGFVETDIIKNAGIDTDTARAALGVTKGLDSEDVADAVVYVLSTPPHVQVHELIVRPIEQR